MSNRLENSNQVRAEDELATSIAVLTPDDVGLLRLPWDGRFTVRELQQITSSGPPVSVWNRRTGEYLIAGPWRHRREIATVIELAAIGSAVDLIRAFVRASAAHGIRMVVAAEQAERRKLEFYESAGLSLVEEIVVYELAKARAPSTVRGALRFERFDPGDRAVFDELLSLDHRSFPWLWWNSEEEFREYYHAPGVQIDVGRDISGRMVSYIGATRFRSWGHLDRIAVAPDLQGRGLGRVALDYAVASLAQSGARRVGLSTQARNVRSKRLYESFGFRRSTAHDYRIYGRMVDGADDLVTTLDDRGAHD
jgi:ribosomal protein S18 acetylase RimI-like enzyme